MHASRSLFHCAAHLRVAVHTSSLHAYSVCEHDSSSLSFGGLSSPLTACTTLLRAYAFTSPIIDSLCVFVMHCSYSQGVFAPDASPHGGGGGG